MHDRVYSPGRLDAGPLTLRGDEAKHLVRVRRVGPGSRVEVFNGEGLAFEALVESVGKDCAELRLEGTPLPDRAWPVALTLATAVPKGDRFDWLVEKATELGIARLVPLITARSVVDPRGAKLERLRRVVVEACKQCGRNNLMTLEAPVAWSEFVRREGTSVRLIAHPGGAPLRTLVESAGHPTCLAIGPEGGFTDEEALEAVQGGWRIADLGPTILRIETAGLVAAAAIFTAGVPTS